MLREALSTTLATLPEQFHSARSELITLLRRDGILHRSPTQPVLSRDGTSARWMLDSLSVTLSPRGAELAGSCLLELLKRFDGRQIATYGLTAVPILQACILQSGGRYRGLLVRKERKEHGSLKLIEGPIDAHEPVVLIDDSVSSGMSMQEGSERLEQAGLRVEGGVCLVRFGWHGGYARMQERGYHMEAVYDIWDDFIAHMADEEQPLANPSKWFPEFEWSSERAPDGLHPAQLARIVIAEYLSTGKLLRAPSRLDQDYDSSGGAWISLRSLQDIHLRHARDGFWHFPGEQSQSAAEDVVLASLRTATDIAKGEAGLKIVNESGIAVTFFTALERCNVGDLDNDRYGIVVRSLERRATMGGALPRMPGIANEWQQFQHARIKNGRLISFEPYEILRHEVVKAVEPDIAIAWQPTGVPATEKLPWQQDENISGRIAERARDFVLARLFSQPETSEPLAADLVPEQFDSVYVTVYINGHLRGCMGASISTRDLDNDLRRLANAALDDTRFESHVPIEPSAVAVTVSLLYNPLEIGQLLPEEVVPYYRHGQQTLMVYRGDRLGLLLPFVAATHNIDRANFPQAVIEKAGLTEPPYYWCRFDCATWLADAAGKSPVVGGFRSQKKPAPSSEELLNYYAPLHAQYLMRQQRADGQLYSSYEPFQNRLHERSDLPRLTHGAWVLARAHRVLGGDDLGRVAGAAIDYVLKTAREHDGCLWLESGNDPASVSEIAFLLLALSNLPDDDPRRASVERLSATLARMVQPHGRIATHRDPNAGGDAFQDYFPGQALLALAVAAEQHSGENQLHRCFTYYRHRFRYQRHFGQVTWLMQAFSEWWHVTRRAEFAEFVFEIGDWLLGYQQKKTGAFINDHQPDTPGYTTAVYLEGVGAAVQLATALDDEARRQKYTEAFRQGFRFLDQLIIQPRDASLLPNIEFALGGLRQGLYYSEVRTDFVQHSLSAILSFCQNRER